MKSGMKISVIGAGNVGKALGIGLARTGHHMCFGVKESKIAENTQLVGDNTSVRSVRDSINFGDERDVFYAA